MLRLSSALLAGALFSLGLIISDMIDPARVLAFLDLFGGAWDPTLAFVMAGGLLPMLIAWQIQKRRTLSLLGEPAPAPASPIIDGQLLLGSASFGAGWGLVGLCPGPALSALLLSGWPIVLFCSAMAVGMLCAARLQKQ